jgi:hypothetical protein
VNQISRFTRVATVGDDVAGVDLEGTQYRLGAMPLVLEFSAA